jgi:Kef-type K+ transport system membrane component KefB/mannitol/fructose-specific phosphotransferase system IIA component (Ntr-type)
MRAPYRIRPLAILSFFVLCALPAFATEGLQDAAMAHEITRLLLQLGVAILAAKLGGRIAAMLRLPALLGEVSAGLLLGPYALGSLPIPGFSDGLVPLASGAFPVSLQLYGFAAVGAVIHVLAVGLESDLGLFARVRQRGFAIALVSSLAALAVGVILPAWFYGYAVLDRRVFFFAALSVSTSLGVQARILHARRRMGTAEGAAIVSASLLQDGFAIVFLAMALALGSADAAAAGLWNAVLPVTAVALAMLVGGGALAFLGAPQLAKAFRKLSSPNLVTVLVVAMALALSAVFESFGVAAIIGAYIIGIAFSRSDIGDLLAEKAQPISEFFVPLLYVVMGMLVDWRVLLKPGIVLPGLAFALASGLAKIAGAGIPALAAGFNRRGALRIGLGTVPRGEVALIIASVGLALGDFSLETFQVMAVMVVFSVGLGAPLLSLALRGGPGTRGAWGSGAAAVTALDLPNEELADLITDGLIRVAEEDGFFTHRLEISGAVYRLRRGEVYLTVDRKPRRLEILCDPEDEGVAKTLLYEVIVHVRDRVARVTELAVPPELRRDAAAGGGRDGFDLGRYLKPSSVVLPLKAADKEGVIRELVAKLAREGLVEDEAAVTAEVLAREAAVGTGMEKGIAIPHGRSSGVRGMALAAGLCPAGADFQATDGEPARLIFLIASSPDDRGPHLQLLAAIAKRMRDEGRRRAALEARSPEAFVAAILN